MTTRLGRQTFRTVKERFLVRGLAGVALCLGLLLTQSAGANGVPNITVQPSNAVAVAGSPASLSVTAGGAALCYQWLKDGVILTGQTNRTLDYASFQFTNSGSYNVVITNAAGMAISFPASLSVSNAPLQAWGKNDRGQLGNGANSNTNLPIQVTNNVVAVAGGGYHSLFVKSDGALWAMGVNSKGELGIGNNTDTNLPTQVTNDVVAVAGGSDHSLFVKADGSLWAMGYNIYGQLGNGTNGAGADTNLPTQVTNDVVAVAAGQNHSLFVKTDGTLWAMGYGVYGQLGNGTNVSTNLPTQVTNNVVAMASGRNHSLFVKADGTLWAMGRNSEGQLGNGTTADTNLPTQVTNNVVGVAAGGNHSLFVKADGSLWAMGYNIYGQLGNGTNGAGANTNLPTYVTNNVVAVAGGSEHSLFVKADGSLWAMGFNGDGELGNGTTTESHVPVLVNNGGLMVASLAKQSLAYHSLAIASAGSGVAAWYVDAAMSDDTGAGTNWATAKKIIQSAVDLAVTAGGTVWVTNGTYSLGGTNASGYALTNRVCITNAITVRSVNGAAVTVIRGSGGSCGDAAVRGVYLTNGASIIGFTITEGRARTTGYGDRNAGGIYLSSSCVASDCIVVSNQTFWDGGGVYLYNGGTVSNCILRKNASSGFHGGGAYLDNGGTMNNCILNENDANCGGAAFIDVTGVLNNCLLSGNSADNGGGIYFYTGGMLNNCTLYGNTAGEGGGLYRGSGGAVLNCIVWSNSANSSPDVGGYNGLVSYTCAGDGVTHGSDGNITNNPLFMASDDFSLAVGSPCIDTGNNAWAPTNVTPYDLAGNLRIINNIVDMGAYERQLFPGFVVLGTNGVAVSSGEAASAVKGTDFGSFTIGAAAATNTFAITNSGNVTLTISGATTSGLQSAAFSLQSLPSAVAAGTASNFSIVFNPSAVGVATASVVIANNSATPSYVVNLRGVVNGQAPTITVQPSNAVVVGQTASLSVTATGAALCYQWLKDGVILTGRTNSTLTYTSFQFTNSGSYTVVITNAAGMAISFPASLSVSNAPLRAWGYNHYGQLGNGTNVNTNLPVTAASNVVTMAGGRFHSLFVKADGTLWAMGRNNVGQLGNGTTADTNLPIQVTNGVVAVAGGRFHSLFVKADGTLWAMGRNNDGQLGNGTTYSTNLPIQVTNGVVAVAAGANHSLFMKADGTLWAMGYNNYGQLGIGAIADTNWPAYVTNNVVAVAGGQFHSLFVKADGTLWAMGLNNKGQLGNGTTTTTNLPIQVTNNVVAVAGSYYHSLFVKEDGTLWAMGDNADGQLGDGTTTNTNRPVLVNGGNLMTASLAKGPEAYHSLAIAEVLRPGMVILGTNGAIIASGAAASAANGTDFGTFTLGAAAVTNTFSVTNSGDATLTISGVTTTGMQNAEFRMQNVPATVATGTASNFSIVFNPSAVGVATASVVIVNNSASTPYVVNLKGTVSGAETNLPTPTGVSATDGTYTNMVRVTWTGVAGATSYDILRNTTPDPNKATFLHNEPAAEAAIQMPDARDQTSASQDSERSTYIYDDTTVVARRSYYYWVRALSGSGVSALSYVGMGYAELGGGQTAGRSDLTVYDMVFLPVNLTNGSPAGTVSYRLLNGGPDALTAAPVRFDFYMVQSNQAAWMAYNETNVTLAVGAEQLIILDASARQWLRVRADLAGRYTVQARVRHLDLIGDGHTGSNTTDAAGMVLVRASGVNSPGRSLNDYDGDGKADGCLYQSISGRWHVRLSGARYGDGFIVGDVGMGWTTAAGDYDGDGLTDMAVYDRLSRQWLVRYTASGLVDEGWLGGPEFAAAQCDFDGDAMTDLVVYRETDGYWLGAASSRQYALCDASLGETGYESVAADYDGDGIADAAVYNRETGLWAIRLSGSNLQVVTGPFGGSGYLPVPADYDGDGMADPAIYAPSTADWQVLPSTSLSASLAAQGSYTAWWDGVVGNINGTPVPADYDGDGLADPAVYNPETSLWELFLSTRGYQLYWGLFGGGPVYQPALE